MDREEIKQVLGLYLEMHGVSNTSQAIKDIAKNTSLLSGNTNDLEKKYGTLGKAIQVLSKEYANMHKSATISGKLHRKAIHELTASYGSLGKAVGGIARLGKSLLLPASFAGAVKTTMAYEKSLLATSARVNRLGIGLRKLETSLMGVSSATGFARQETIELFQEFEKGMAYVNFGDFQNALQRIIKIVGANSGEAKKYIGTLSSLSQKYPILVKNIMKGGKALDGYSESMAKSLYLSNKLGTEEYRNIMSIIRGNRQLSQAGSRDYEEYQKHIKAMQAFRRQVEKVALLFGRTLFPVLTRIGNWMEKNLQTTGNWVSLLIKASLALGTVKVGMAAAGGYFQGRIAGGVLAGSIGGGAAVSKVAAGGMAGINPASVLGMGGAAYVAPKVGRLAKGMTNLKGAGILKSGGAAAIGGTIAYAAGGALEKKFAEEGRYQAAGVAGVTKSAGAIAGAAGTGAMIGTMIPVIGTAIGAVIGGVIGLIAQIDDLEVSISRLVEGKTLKDFLEVPPEIAEELAKIGREVERLESLKKVKKKVMEDPFDMEKYKQAMEFVKVAERKFDDARKKFDEGMTIKYKEEGKTWLSSDDFDKERKKREDEKGQINIRIAKYQKDPVKYKDHIKAEKNALDLKEEQLKVMIRTRVIEEEGNDKLRGATNALSSARAKAEGYMEMIRMQGLYSEKVTASYQAQVSLLSSIVELMGLTGQVDFSGLGGSFKESLMFSFRAEEEAFKHLEQLVGAWEIKAEKLEAAKKVGNEGEITKAYDAEQLALKDIINKREELAKIGSMRIKSISAQAKAYDPLVRNVELQSQQLQKIVSLSSNYAIGVGATVKLRAKLYQMDTKLIETLHKQKRIQEEHMAMYQSIAHTKEGKQGMLDAENKLLEISNKILDSHVRRAETVKALRDGWIGAISAMNTGAGTFTKILFTETQAMGSALRMAGDAAVLSGPSGALTSGYRTSEQFSVWGQALQRSKGFTPAYSIKRSYIDDEGKKQTVDLSNAQLFERKAAEEVSPEMVDKVQGQVDAMSDNTASTGQLTTAITALTMRMNAFLSAGPESVKVMASFAKGIKNAQVSAARAGGGGAGVPSKLPADKTEGGEPSIQPPSQEVQAEIDVLLKEIKEKEEEIKRETRAVADVEKKRQETTEKVPLNVGLYTVWKSKTPKKSEEQLNAEKQIKEKEGSLGILKDRYSTEYPEHYTANEANWDTGGTTLGGGTGYGSRPKEGGSGYGSLFKMGGAYDLFGGIGRGTRGRRRVGERTLQVSMKRQEKREKIKMKRREQRERIIMKRQGSHSLSSYMVKHAKLDASREEYESRKRLRTEDSPTASLLTTQSPSGAVVNLGNLNFNIRIDGAGDIGQQVARQVESKIQSGVVNAMNRISV